MNDQGAAKGKEIPVAIAACKVVDLVLGQAKIGNLQYWDESVAKWVLEKQILWLQIKVHYIVFVQIHKATDSLSCKLGLLKNGKSGMLRPTISKKGQRRASVPQTKQSQLVWRSSVLCHLMILHVNWNERCAWQMPWSFGNARLSHWGSSSSRTICLIWCLLLLLQVAIIIKLWSDLAIMACNSLQEISSMNDEILHFAVLPVETQAIVSQEQKAQSNLSLC